MAYETNLETIGTLPAAADLSTKQYFFVFIDTNGNVALSVTAGRRCLGVLQNKPSAAGRACTVGTDGVSKVVAGAAIAIGDLVASDGAGKARTAVTGDHVQGEAITASAADGTVISVMLQKQDVV